MIQRRQFLNATAATALAYPALGSLFNSVHAAGPVSADRNLNWYCDIVRTIDHTESRRHPVVTDVAIQPQGNRLAVVGDDHFVCIYDLEKKTFTHELSHHGDWVRAVEFSPAGDKMATGGNDRHLIICNIDNLQRPTLKKRHPGAIVDLAFSPDGGKLATVGFEPTIRIYDVETGKEIVSRTCPCGDMRAVAFSPDGQSIAAGGRNGEIAVWDAATMQAKTQFRHHRQRIRTIDFTPRGQVISGSEDQTVCITNPADSKNTTRMPRVAAKMFATELLGGGFLATGGSDNQIRIWHMPDFTNIGKLTGHTGTVTSLAANGRILVSGGYDTTVRIWQMDLDASASVNLPKTIRQSKSSDGWNPKFK